MKLKGPLTKIQFEKCVKYVLQDEAGKEEDHMVGVLDINRCMMQCDSVVSLFALSDICASRYAH